MRRAYGMGWEEHMDGKSVWPSLKNIMCHSLPLATITSFHLQLHLPSPGRQLSFHPDVRVITSTDGWLVHSALEMQLDTGPPLLLLPRVLL